MATIPTQFSSTKCAINSEATLLHRVSKKFLSLKGSAHSFISLIIGSDLLRAFHASRAAFDLCNLHIILFTPSIVSFHHLFIFYTMGLKHFNLKETSLDFFFVAFCFDQIQKQEEDGKSAQGNRCGVECVVFL